MFPGDDFKRNGLSDGPCDISTPLLGRNAWIIIVEVSDGQMKVDPGRAKSFEHGLRIVRVSKIANSTKGKAGSSRCFDDLCSDKLCSAHKNYEHYQQA